MGKTKLPVDGKEWNEMIEKERIAGLMNIFIEDCGKCPLERICDENDCLHVWEKFFESKVKEDGVDRGVL